jgi:hypothetical protein
MPRTKLPHGSVPVTFRVLRQTQEGWAEKAWHEKLSLAEFIRRALRREIEAGIGAPRKETLSSDIPPANLSGAAPKQAGLPGAGSRNWNFLGKMIRIAL